MPANERINAMNNAATESDRTEEELFAFEISDEALESAAGMGLGMAANPTIALCTGLDSCPF
jgi:hypothetical protein